MDITCLCPTYGRPETIEETIESFLRQDFEGKKELIIWNDYDQQTLVFEHPEVTIVNSQDRFKTLGDKYNAMIEMARGKYITPFEDDDVFLPHRLSHSCRILEYFNADYHKLPYAICMDYGEMTEIAKNLFFCAGMWTKELALKCMCDSVNSNADQTIEGKLKEKARNYRLEKLTDLEDIYYVYYWGGRTYHLSGYGEGDEALLKAQSDLRKNSKKGLIELKPHWNIDYTSLAKEYIKNKEIPNE